MILYAIEKALYFNGNKHFETSINILKRLKYDNKTIDKVLTLIKYQDYEIGEFKQLKRILSVIGENRLRDILEIKEAYIKTEVPNHYEIKHKTLLEAQCSLNKIIEEKQCYSLKDLNINGNDLLNLGIHKGKEIGIILEKLLLIVLDNPELNCKEKLLEVVKKEFV